MYLQGSCEVPFMIVNLTGLSPDSLVPLADTMSCGVFLLVVAVVMRLVEADCGRAVVVCTTKIKPGLFDFK